MARYGDLDALEKKLFPMGVVDDGRYALPAKAVKVAIDRLPTADVVPKSEEGAECPTCHGTGRIGTTNWLTKNMTKKQIAEEKAKAIAEHEQYIKSEVARKIFEEIDRAVEKAELEWGTVLGVKLCIAELRQKIEEDQNG